MTTLDIVTCKAVKLPFTKMSDLFILKAGKESTTSTETVGQVVFYQDDKDIRNVYKPPTYNINHLLILTKSA